ncbi:MAG TPA: helix-turn-helix transcriptional regulator [Candidatus Limnocylindrales bacterium]|nr:helix-turn-helix transcriptional regulator [Candidatus Limnocylindrales bacterium]
MTDVQVGRVFRAVRRRRGLRQVDVASMAGTSANVISRIERGRLDEVSFRALRRVAAVLEIDLGVTARWRGGELGRLINDRHALLHGVVLELLDGFGAWVRTPEVSFNVWGERGIVDIAAWHEASRTLLLVELKTELVDPQELVGVMDRRRRLGREISASLGWEPLVIATWVVLADTRTNRRHLARHARLLRAAFPADGRAMGRWLRRPAGRIDALSFLPYSREARASRETTGPRRIRHVPEGSPTTKTLPRRPRDGSPVRTSRLAPG